MTKNKENNSIKTQNGATKNFINDRRRFIYGTYITIYFSVFSLFSILKIFIIFYVFSKFVFPVFSLWHDFM